MASRRAVIDIGTNSVKVLVGDVDSSAVFPVYEQSHQTRLGKGLYEDSRLHPDAIADTSGAVQRFASEATRLGASCIRAIATSAVREASNSDDLKNAILQRAGLATEIITGEQEADLAFRGAATDPELAHARMLLLDMGGGSTEMIVGTAGKIEFRHSFRLGTLRIMSLVNVPDNPSPQDLSQCRKFLKDYMRREVKPQLDPVLNLNGQPRRSGATLLVGTGGTATILGRLEAGLEGYDRAIIESTRLSVERLRWHIAMLWSTPLEQRRKLRGLPSNRADVILPGAAAYGAIMEELGFGELRVSTRGLRFAALME